MKYLVIVIFLGIVLISCEKDGTNNNNTTDVSLSMGQGYMNDVFYGLNDNNITTADRTSWDIAFNTYVMSPSILINGGNGVKLFEVSKDTNDWYNPVDTSGISSWTKLNNSNTTWDIGAFSGNMGGGFDFGWGVYLSAPSHNVVGSSVFLIKLPDNSARKILIRMKNGYQNSVNFVYANIDGTEEKNVTIYCNDYSDKEYVYYSVSSNSVIDREPPADNWDLLFTQYYDTQINYIVTGVLSKPGVKVAKVTGVAPSAADTTMADFSSSISTIGYDWKQIDMMTYQYSLVENVSYFVKTTGNHVYQLYFSDFEGSSTGNIKFKKKMIK